MDKNEEIKTLKARSMDLTKWLNNINAQIPAVQKEIIQNDAKIQLLLQQIKQAEVKKPK